MSSFTVAVSGSGIQVHRGLGTALTHIKSHAVGLGHFELVACGSRVWLHLPFAKLAPEKTAAAEVSVRIERKNGKQLNID